MKRPEHIIEDLITRQLDGTPLTDTERRELQEWLEASEANRDAFLRAYKAWGNARLAETRFNTGQALENVMARIAEASRPRSFRGRNCCRLGIGIAAAACVMLADCRLLPTATVDRPGHRNVYPAGRHPRIHPERGATGAVRAENPPARNPKIDNPLRFDRHPDQQRRKNHSQKRGCDVQPAGRSLRQADDADARRRNPRLDQRRITAGLPRRIRKAEARNIRRRRNLHGSGARCRTAFLGTHRQNGCLRFGNQILHILLRAAIARRRSSCSPAPSA